VGFCRPHAPEFDLYTDKGTGKVIKVLFIEDDADVANLIQIRLLRQEVDTVDIRHVTELRAALVALNSEHFDAVLTDLNLPDSVGIKTIRRILAVRREIPLVVHSTIAEESMVLQVLQAGAQEYVIKGQGDGYVVGRAIRSAIERKRTELKLQRLAHYDNLTGLANRTLFHKRLEHALARAARCQGGVALMVMDLDRFKTINDTLGHHAGDRMLVQVAERLKPCVREQDTVARLGGDEFTIILERVSTTEEAAVVARKIIDAMSAPFELEAQSIYVTPSIGITLFPYDDDGVDGLLKNADAAMYQAKAKGRNGFQFFTAGMNERSVERLKIEVGLRQAIENEELLLHYQPKVNLQTGRIQAMEALVRWQRPATGLVPPMDFIPIAEDTGLIIPIGEWVMRKALAQTRIWLDNGLPVARVAINMSARQFRQSDLAAFISEALRESGLNGEHLEIELTESALMEDMSASVAVLQHLKKLGVRVAIDDFGTGYSSLNYLKRFPIDTLKIDRSFVSDIPNDQDDATITTAIIGLAHNLRLNVIAEGVETPEQVEFLRANRCDEAQGFLFSRPLTVMQMTACLQRERSRSMPLQLSVIDGGQQIAI
jgi:diguanylate cyclase (GGDEF)-like protein